MRPLFAVLCAAVLADPLAAQASQLTIDVDPRIELFSIVQYIAGRMDNGLETPYGRDVHAHFDRFRDHRAVRLIQAMVPDVMSWGIPAALGVAVDSLPGLRAHQPLPSKLAVRPLPPDTVALYVAAVRDFAGSSDFLAFFSAHRALYTRLVDDTRRRIGPIDYLSEVERFWGERKGLYAIHLSPLMPAGGVSRFAEGSAGREVHAVLGAGTTRDSVPVFGTAASLRNLILHEFSHAFMNPMTERHQQAVDQWELLLDPVRNRLRQADGITTWPEAVNELVIRAFNANSMARNDGDTAASRFIEGQRALGFVYLPRFREWLREYEDHRNRWSTFNDYYPRLLEHFADLAGGSFVSDSLQPRFTGNFAMAQWANEEFFFVFIVPTAERDAASQDSLYSFVRKLRDLRFPTSMIVRDVDAVTQDLSRFSIWAWGTVQGNLWLRRQESTFPIRVFGDSVVAGDSTYRGQSMVVTMAVRNPQNSRYPLLVSTGQRIEEVCRFSWNWPADYAIMDGLTRRAIGDWPVKTETKWGFTSEGATGNQKPRL